METMPKVPEFWKRFLVLAVEMCLVSLQVEYQGGVAGSGFRLFFQ